MNWEVLLKFLLLLWPMKIGVVLKKYILKMQHYEYELHTLDGKVVYQKNGFPEGRHKYGFVEQNALGIRFIFVSNIGES
jgi:hypothetical protein